MSTLLNKSTQSDSALSTQALPLCKSSGDLNVLKCKTSGDWNVPQSQKVTFGITNTIMQAIAFMMTPSPIVSNDQNSMVKEAWKLATEAQDCQWGLAGAPVRTLSVCQLPAGPSLIIDPYTQDAVSHAFC